MGVKTKSTTWPYAYKTIAMSESNQLYVVPYSIIPNFTGPTVGSELGLQIYPPLYIYKPTGLFMHLNYTFNASLQTADQTLLGIYVRDTPSSLIRAGGSTIEKFMPLNVAADINHNINISLDLTSLLTGQATNVVFLRFGVNNSQQFRGPLSILGDNIGIWKLDLMYQTIGIRNEK